MKPPQNSVWFNVMRRCRRWAQYFIQVSQNLVIPLEFGLPKTSYLESPTVTKRDDERGRRKTTGFAGTINLSWSDRWQYPPCFERNQPPYNHQLYGRTDWKFKNLHRAMKRQQGLLVEYRGFLMVWTSALHNCGFCQWTIPPLVFRLFWWSRLKEKTSSEW